MRRAAALIVAAVALAAGCGGPAETEEEPTPQQRMDPTPLAIRSACETAASRYDGTVLCPTRLPASRDPALLEFGSRPRGGRCEWLVGIQLRAAASHVLAGGQCRPLPLEAEEGRWPADPARVRRGLGLAGAGAAEPGDAAREPGPAVRPHVVREGVPVREAEGLLVAYEADPEPGTMHGGHQALLWNEDGQGFVVSAHFDRDVPAALRLELLRAVAESMRPAR